MNNICRDDLVIKNINILSMNDSRILKNKTIIIRSGVIDAIENGSVDLHKDTPVIEGKNRFIMPGLINMHTHLGDNKDDLLLYLVNGITTIRNMWGYEGFSIMSWLFGTKVFDHLQLKRQVEEGDVIGPNIFTAGQMLDGDPPFFPKFMDLRSVKEKKQIERIIKEQVSKGYDFIKIYSALTKQNFDDIIETAENCDIPVAGHIPDLVDIRHALGSGMRSIEHLTGFINIYRPEQSVRKEAVKELAALAAANCVWSCPTLIANERLANIGRQREFENEDQMKYISEKNKKAMRFLMKESDRLFNRKRVKGNHFHMDDFIYIIRQLKNEGAGILMGTDKAVPYVVAGFSEHMEMKMLSKAGLTNYEVLQTATINAARCLNKADIIGTVESGKRADMIITDKDPLDDLDTIYGHAGVIKSGVLFSREKCDDILKGVKKSS